MFSIEVTRLIQMLLASTSRRLAILTSYPFEMITGEKTDTRHESGLRTHFFAVE